MAEAAIAMAPAVAIKAREPCRVLVEGIAFPPGGVFYQIQEYRTCKY
jgi:hypothetical protein